MTRGIIKPLDLESQAPQGVPYTSKMHVDPLYLRERMRSLSADDLRQVVQNKGLDYTSTTVEAAQNELAERPPATFDVTSADDGPPAADLSSRTRLPVGLWWVFCVATGTVIAGTLATCVALTVVLVTAATMADILATLRVTIAAAVIAFWLAAAIRAERSSARVLLLSIIVTAAVYRAALVWMAWPPTGEDLNTLGLIAVAYWYFKHSATVSEYYRDLQRRGHQGSPADGPAIASGSSSR